MIMKLKILKSNKGQGMMEYVLATVAVTSIFIMLFNAMSTVVSSTFVKGAKIIVRVYKVD